MVSIINIKNGVKEPIHGHQIRNSNQILIFVGYVQVRDHSIPEWLFWIDAILDPMDTREILPSLKFLTWHIGPNGIGNKNIVKHPYPTGNEKLWNPHYNYPNETNTGLHHMYQLRNKISLDGCSLCLLWSCTIFPLIPSLGKNSNIFPWFLPNLEIERFRDGVRLRTSLWDLAVGWFQVELFPQGCSLRGSWNMADNQPWIMHECQVYSRLMTNKFNWNFSTEWMLKIFWLPAELVQ